MSMFEQPENITSMLSFLKYVSTLTEVGGVPFLGIGMLLAIGFVSFLVTKAYTFERAAGFASFITLMSAILLRFMNLINDVILFFVAVLFVGSVIMLMRERNVEEYGV